MTRTQKRIAIAGTAATAAAAVLLVGLFRDGGGTAQAVSVQPAVTTDRLQSGFAAGNTAGLVKTLVANVREHPGEARTYTLLGLAYQQRARETGNPVYYTKSGGVLARAIKLAPERSDNRERTGLAGAGPPPLRGGAPARTAGREHGALHRSQLRRPRRLARRARTLRRGLPRLRPDGQSASRSFVVLADRVRARAARQHESRAPSHGARPRRGRQPARADGVGPHAARQACVVARAGWTRRNGTTGPPLPHSRATSTRWSRWRSSRRRRAATLARSTSPTEPPRAFLFLSRSRHSVTSMPAPGASAPRQSSTRSSASSNGCWSQTAFAPISRLRSSTSTTA